MSTGLFASAVGFQLSKRTWTSAFGSTFAAQSASLTMFVTPAVLCCEALWHFAHSKPLFATATSSLGRPTWTSWPALIRWVPGSVGRPG